MAKLIEECPSERDDILRELHQHPLLGNGFVAEVLQAKSSSGAIAQANSIADASAETPVQRKAEGAPALTGSDGARAAVQQRNGTAPTRAQAKATISAPGDAHEKEADRAATLNLKARGADQDAPLPKIPLGMEGLRSADTAPDVIPAITGRADSSKQAARTKNDALVGDLVIAIDQSARSGLATLAGKSPDLDEANRFAALLAGRIDHLLSAVAASGEMGVDISAFKQEASVALGRAEEFAGKLAHAGGSPAGVRHALDRAAPELASKLKWTWTAVKVDQPKVGGGLRRRGGFEIGINTLAMVGQRARAGSAAKDKAVVKSACATCQSDLSHANTELTLALSGNDPALKSELFDVVFDLSGALADLEGAAYAMGIGEDSVVNGMRDQETAVRMLAGFATQRPFWDSALPTINAIIDILGQYVHVVNGLGYAKGHPSQHPEVPARYHPLLQQWFDIVAGVDPTTKVKIRGPALAKHLDVAIGQTAALTNLIDNEATPGTTNILDDYYAKVTEFRHRALEQTVMDPIDAKTQAAVEKGDSPIDHLDEDHQIKLASTRLMTVARALTSSGSRLASAGKAEAQIAMDAFKAQLKDAPIAAALKEELASAKSLSDVAGHIVALARGIDAVMALADPKRREELFHKQFAKYGPVAGIAEIGKTAGALVQGGIAAYSIGGYAFLRARGLPEEAASAFSKAGKAISNIGVALNVLNIVHGAIVMAEGEGTTEKISGAVEATVGLLGVVGKFAPTLARFTGPLAASVLIGWTTIKWLGDVTMGALAGMIQLALNPAFENMKLNARMVHVEAMKLAIMLDTAATSPPKDPEQLALLQEQIRTLTHILAQSINGYVDRTQSGGGGDANPGSWKAFALRFKPLVGVKLDTTDDVLLASEEFLTIVVGCFNNAGQILEESVKQSVDEHG